MAEGQPSPEAIRLGQRIFKAAGGQFRGEDRPVPRDLAALKEKVLPPSREEQERRERLWRETHELLASAPSAEGLERWANLPPEIRDGVVSAYKDARNFRDAVEKSRTGAERKQERALGGLRAAYQNLQSEQAKPVAAGPEGLVSQDQKRLAKLQESHLRAREQFQKTNASLEKVRAKTAGYPEGKAEQINRKFENADAYLERQQRLQELWKLVEESKANVLDRMELVGIERQMESYRPLPRAERMKVLKLDAIVALSTIVIDIVTLASREPGLVAIGSLWTGAAVSLEFSSLFAGYLRSGINRAVGIVEERAARASRRTDFETYIEAANGVRISKWLIDRLSVGFEKLKKQREKAKWREGGGLPPAPMRDMPIPVAPGQQYQRDNFPVPPA